MNEISNYFKPVAVILFVQLVNEVVRMRNGKAPMAGFVICALALVLMDLFTVLFILPASFSDVPGENAGNGLLLILVGALACVAFFSGYCRLIHSLYMEFKKDRKRVVLLQALPTLALLFVFLSHAKRIFVVGWMLYSGGWGNG